MLRCFVVLLLILLIPRYLDAQIQIKGRVVDALTGEPVENASVVLAKFDLRVTTNVAGVFVFSDLQVADEETISLHVRHEGFAYREFVLNDLDSLKMNYLDISPELPSGIAGGIIDEALADDDSESSSQEISALVSISNDVYLNTANFQLSPFRFKIRGYSSRHEQKYINGVSFNDQLRGVFNFTSVGALNDLTRNGDKINFHNPSSFSFGSIGGSENIIMRAGNYGKGKRFTVSLTNRNYYLRSIASHSTGLMDNGWAFTAVVGGRYAHKGNVEGTSYRNMAYAFALEKQWKAGEHSLSLTTFGSPIARGMQSASYQEAYDLTGNNLYNPVWGWQNGKQRNSKEMKAYDPTAIISYLWKPNRLTTLAAGLGIHYGMYGSTALNWFGSDPRPDYYRYLPSFSDNDPAIAELWRNKDPTVTQIDWNKLYYANLYSCTDGDGSAIYLIENRRSDLFEISFNASLSGTLYERLKIDAGIGLRTSVSDQYKTVDDLLGAKFVLDIDKFAEQDFPTSSDIKQNDLNHPQRKAIRGSVFGYEFLIDINSANFWIQNRHPSKWIDFHYGTKLTYTEFRRDGRMKNGRYPNNSYGKGTKHSFVDMAFKGGANFKISGRHFITLNLSYASEAPLAYDAYISPRISDKVLPDLKSGKIFSADVNYIFSLSAINGRVSVFQTNFNDQILRQAYYSDFERTFVNHVMGGLNKVHRGIEFGLAYKPNRRWTFYLLGTLAEYYYANNPEGTICYENARSENMNETVYLRNYYVGGTPQKAGVLKVNYFYKYWFFNFCVNGTDGNYVDIATIKRLVSNYTTVTPTDEESYEAYKILTSQERFKASFTLDLSVGKILYLPNKSSIVLGLTLNNVLNDKNIRAMGYEQGRLDLEAPRKFAAKYYYMQGINGFLNVSYRFN